ncbi:MAG: sulfite exporter TauE/SafE family protein [Gaiellaceae bacterium]|nr:sulfite exporter TauE/SafE family protein [Acidobacteriota bacterium]
MHWLVFAAVAAWSFTTAFAGGLVGLVLGNIRLPVIVFAASSPAAGAGANIGISGVAAATAFVTHLRAGRIDWRLVAWMVPPSVAGAVGGSMVAAHLPGDALLIVIGVALLVFGIDLLRPRRVPPRRQESGSGVRAAVIAGAVIGFLGGVVGLILGSLRMPALLRFVGADPLRAVGTNLLVGVCVGVAGIAAHAPSGVDWTLFAVGATASIPGALLGSRLTGRLDERRLLLAVGTILLVAGTAAILQATL